METVKAFERTNSIRISLEGGMTDRDGVRDMVWTAYAFDAADEAGAPIVLASASVPCLGSGLVTMDAVIFQLLYALDFRLAEHALYSALKPKA